MKYREESFPVKLKVKLANGKWVRRIVYWDYDKNNKRYIYIKDRSNKKILVEGRKNRNGNWYYHVI